MLQFPELLFGEETREKGVLPSLSFGEETRTKGFLPELSLGEGERTKGILPPLEFGALSREKGILPPIYFTESQPSTLQLTGDISTEINVEPDISFYPIRGDVKLQIGVEALIPLIVEGDIQLQVDNVSDIINRYDIDGEVNTAIHLLTEVGNQFYGNSDVGVKIEVLGEGESASLYDIEIDGVIELNSDIEGAPALPITLTIPTPEFEMEMDLVGGMVLDGEITLDSDISILHSVLDGELEELQQEHTGYITHKIVFSGEVELDCEINFETRGAIAIGYEIGGGGATAEGGIYLNDVLLTSGTIYTSDITLTEDSVILYKGEELSQFEIGNIDLNGYELTIKFEEIVEQVTLVESVGGYLPNLRSDINIYTDTRPDIDQKILSCGIDMLSSIEVVRTIKGEIDTEAEGLESEISYSKKGVFDIDGLIELCSITDIETGEYRYTKTIAINIGSRGISEYENYGFVSMVYHGGKYYGSNANGLYELSGEKDETTDINSLIKTPKYNIISNTIKRPKDLWVVSETSGELEVIVYGDEEVGDEATGQYKVVETINEDIELVTDTIKTSYRYPLEKSRDTMATHKAHLGRGVEGIYMQTGIANKEGADFTLKSMEMVIVEGRRKW